MSLEQPYLETSPISAQEANFFGNNDQLDLHKSNLESIDVIRARQAIAAAVATTASGSIEMNTIQVTTEKLTPQKAIAKVTWQILAMRQDFDAQSIDLFAEDEAIAAELLRQPLESKSPDTKDAFHLAA